MISSCFLRPAQLLPENLSNNPQINSTCLFSGVFSSFFMVSDAAQWIRMLKNSKNRGEESVFSAAYIESQLEYSKLVEIVDGKIGVV